MVRVASRRDPAHPCSWRMVACACCSSLAAGGAGALYCAGAVAVGAAVCCGGGRHCEGCRGGCGPGCCRCGCCGGVVSCGSTVRLAGTLATLKGTRPGLVSQDQALLRHLSSHRGRQPLFQQRQRLPDDVHQVRRQQRLCSDWPRCAALPQQPAACSRHGPLCQMAIGGWLANPLCCYQCSKCNRPCSLKPSICPCSCSCRHTTSSCWSVPPKRCRTIVRGQCCCQQAACDWRERLRVCGGGPECFTALQAAHGGQHSLGTACCSHSSQYGASLLLQARQKVAAGSAALQDLEHKVQALSQCKYVAIHAACKSAGGLTAHRPAPAATATAQEAYAKERSSQPRCNAVARLRSAVPQQHERLVPRRVFRRHSLQECSAANHSPTVHYALALTCLPQDLTVVAGEPPAPQVQRLLAHNCGTTQPAGCAALRQLKLLEGRRHAQRPPAGSKLTAAVRAQNCRCSGAGPLASGLSGHGPLLGCTLPASAQGCALLQPPAPFQCRQGHPGRVLRAVLPRRMDLPPQCTTKVEDSASRRGGGLRHKDNVA